MVIYLYNIKTHIDNMLKGGAIISGTGVTLEGVGEVPTVQVVITQVIMASPNGFFDTIDLKK